MSVPWGVCLRSEQSLRLLHPGILTQCGPLLASAAVHCRDPTAAAGLGRPSAFPHPLWHSHLEHIFIFPQLNGRKTYTDIGLNQLWNPQLQHHLTIERQVKAAGIRASGGADVTADQTPKRVGRA